MVCVLRHGVVASVSYERRKRRRQKLEEHSGPNGLCREKKERWRTASEIMRRKVRRGEEKRTRRGESKEIAER